MSSWRSRGRKLVSDFFVELFRRQSSLDRLAVRVEDWVSAQVRRISPPEIED